MSNTEQIPTGFHLATAKERQCLPKGSKYVDCFGGLNDSHCAGEPVATDATYFCPDAPEVPEGYHLATADELRSFLPAGSRYIAASSTYLCPDAPAPNMESFGVQHEPKSGWPSLSVTPTLDPKRAAGALKPQLQLIPPVFNETVAAALSHGADKYGPWNWRENKVEMMTYLGAMKRHIDALLDGEDIDPDSGVSHFGLISASCAIVLDAGKHGTLVDNRPPQKP